jgi:hypothetical protein
MLAETKSLENIYPPIRPDQKSTSTGWTTQLQWNRDCHIPRSLVQCTIRFLCRDRSQLPSRPRTVWSAVGGPRMDPGEPPSHVNNPARGTDACNWERRSWTKRTRRIFETYANPLLVEKGDEGSFVSDKRFLGECLPYAPKRSHGT